MKSIRPAFATALAAGILLAGGALAQPAGPDSLGSGWRQQQNEAREAVRQRRLASLSSIIAEIGRRTPGQQLDAGLEQQGGRDVYRVRWMTRDGRRIDYIVDAVTGAILSGN